MVATPCLQWAPQGLALNDVVSVPRTAWLGTMSSKLISRTRSFEYRAKQRAHCPIRRAGSASFDTSSDEDFDRRIQEFALNFRGSDDNEHPASIEMKANSVEIPLSLRMIKQKKKKGADTQWPWQSSAYCSVKKAFSSMVFIIRELHSYTLQMREVLYYEDLQGILSRVQQEMHASFVWLFQQVFSHTPTLMVYVMILLANFTVHSMSSSPAFASVTAPIVAAAEEREVVSGYVSKSFSMKPSSNGGKTMAVGGNGGGDKFKVVGSGMDGDGWGDKSGSIHRSVFPDGVSPFRTREHDSTSVSGKKAPDGVSPFNTREEESASVSGKKAPDGISPFRAREQESASVSGQEEWTLWNDMVDEASRQTSDIEGLDHRMHNFVSPVTANIDEDVKSEDYFRTELLYQTELSQEPSNVLLLANYAQFLYLVVHDYDRAEEYFKRAIGVEPKDAEAHSKYAHFLWQVRKDLWAAEETFLEAISADPTNSFYAANYAHFLWNTGGEDTCFPLDSDDNQALDT